MKAQDLYLALYFWGRELQQKNLSSWEAAPNESGIRAIASESGVPLGSCHRSLKHLLDIGLIRTYEDGYRANIQALSGILVYGVRYFFPARPSTLVRGVPTAHSSPFWIDKLVGGEDMLVWPHGQGSVKGLGIEPLHPGAVGAALHMQMLYHLLTLCDMFRTGGTRDIEQAKAALKDIGGSV